MLFTEVHTTILPYQQVNNIKIETNRWRYVGKIYLLQWKLVNIFFFSDNVTKNWQIQINQWIIACRSNQHNDIVAVYIYKCRQEK